MFFSYEYNFNTFRGRTMSFSILYSLIVILFNMKINFPYLFNYMIGRGGRWNELLAGGPHAPIAPLSTAMTQIAYIMRWICGRATAIPKCASPYPFLISLKGRPTMSMAP